MVLRGLAPSRRRDYQNPTGITRFHAPSRPQERSNEQSIISFCTLRLTPSGPRNHQKTISIARFCTFMVLKLIGYAGYYRISLVLDIETIKIQQALQGSTRLSDLKINQMNQVL